MLATWNALLKEMTMVQLSSGVEEFRNPHENSKLLVQFMNKCMCRIETTH
jgi:hypothetical protein